MGDVKWIKIVTDIFDDDKILLIEALPSADSIITIWFKLLCLAGKQNNSGVFVLNNRIPYTSRMLATIFRREQSVVDLALQTFENFGMIEIIDGIITIPNWEKHQSLDQLEKHREYMRNYMADKRQQQRLIANQINCKVNGEVNCKVNGEVNSKVNSKTNVSDTDKNRLDRDIELDKSDSVVASLPSTSGKRFIKPTLEEINAYMEKSGYYIDAERFLDYYDSNGWMVGKNHMKDWKATVRTWTKREKTQPQPKQEQPKQRPGNYFIPTGETTDYQDDENLEPLVPEEIVKQGTAAQNKWLDEHGY